MENKKYNILYKDNSIELIDKETTIGKIEFNKINKDTYLIIKTEVNENYQGQGLAKLLVETAYNFLTKNNYKIEYECSYAKNWAIKNNKI